MKSCIVTFAGLFGSFATLALLVGTMAGCGEDDYERQATYPQPIGYTNPPSQPPASTTELAMALPAPPQSLPAPPVDDEVTTGAQSVVPAAGEDYADADPSALTDFRSTLDPYGRWVDDPTYGTIWVPSESVVGNDFTPYQTAGHWAYDDDYTWVSDYDWGWAPFHYGRWAYASPYGWGWVPGRTYAGAWVSWRYGYGDWGYVGWAPLGPTWGWQGGMAYGLGFVPGEPYGYCAAGNLFAPQVGGYMVAPGQAGVIGAHTRPYVAANPGVNGRVAATPRVGGPPPQIMRIPASAVTHGALANRGVVQAQAYAHAGTAASLGAHEPQAFATRGPVGPRVPAYGSSTPSHFGGRLGSGFQGSAASQRPSYAPSYQRGYGGDSGQGLAYRGGSGAAGSPSRGAGYTGAPYRGGGIGYGGGAPGAHPTTSGHSSGTTYSDGGYSGGHHGGGFTGGHSSFGGGFHGGTGVSGGGGGHGGGGFSGGGHGGGGHR